MKSQLVICILVSLVAFAHCFPGANRDREDTGVTNDKPDVDIRFVNPFRDSGLGGNDDDDRLPFRFGFGFTPIGNPFSELWEGFESRMRQIREQMMSRLPSFGIYPFEKIPKGANTTSTTNIIDGHIVTINETTYGDNNSDSSIVFKIRTIDIKPENGTDIFGTSSDGDDDSTDSGERVETDREPVTTRPSNKTTERSVETVEDLGNNEIPNGQVETLQA